MECCTTSGVKSGESESRKLSALGFFTDILLCLFLAFTVTGSSRLDAEEFRTVEPLPLELPDSLVALDSAVRLDIVDGAGT